NVITYFLESVKAVRKCTADYTAVSGSANCFNALAAPVAPAGAGFVLHGGITVLDFDNGGCAGNVCGERIVVDWNGKTAPNAYGEDQIQLCFSYGLANWTIGATAIPPGGLAPCPDQAASVALYNTIMNN